MFAKERLIVTTIFADGKYILLLIKIDVYIKKKATQKPSSRRTECLQRKDCNFKSTQQRTSQNSSTMDNTKLCKNREEFYEIQLKRLKCIKMNQEKKKRQPRLRLNSEDT